MKITLPPLDKVVAFDFDNTLATYKSGQYPKLGEPIWPMVRLLAEVMRTHECWIFTARVSADNRDYQDQKDMIKGWVTAAVITVINQMPGTFDFFDNLTIVTCTKSRRMGLIIDDIAVRPEPEPITAPTDGAKTALEILEESIEIYKERNTTYGDSYKQSGPVLEKMFPNGLTMKTAEEWNRLGAFLMVIFKMQRYSASLVTGGHKDSARDAIVYSAMLEELTQNK